MKLIVRKEDNVVIGAHMIGSDAPEIMQSIAIAVKAKLKKSDFDLTGFRFILLRPRKSL